MTIVGYHTQPGPIKESTNKTDTGTLTILTSENIIYLETQTVFLKCFIQLTESDIEAVPWIGGRNEDSRLHKRNKRNISDRNI